MGLLMFVVLFGHQAWQKFRGNGPPPADGGLADNRIAPPAKRPDDFPGLPRDPLAQAPADARLAEAQPGAERPASERPGERPIMPGDLKLPEARPALPIDGKRLFGGVSSKLFDVLADDAVYRSAENNTFFTLLKALEQSDARDVELASIGRKTFIQLHEQSAEYRGEIVTIGGVVERVLPQADAPTNKQGIRKFYEMWIRPDGGRLPIVVVCLDLPPDYPIGARTEVDVSGYFYKRLGYASAEAAKGDVEKTGTKNVFRTSPLVLAKTVRVRPQLAVAPVAAAVDDGGPAILRGIPLPVPAQWVIPILGIGMIVLVGLSAFAYKLTKTSVTSRGPIVGRRRNEPETPATNLNSIRLEP